MLVFMHDFLILKISESDIFGISEELQEKKGAGWVGAASEVSQAQLHETAKRGQHDVRYCALP